MLDLIRHVGRRLLLPAATKHVEELRDRALAAPRGHVGVERLAGFRVEHVDLLSLYIEFKDIFGHRLYDFQCERADPRVLDGGACIGMAALYVKKHYPDARVTCFEPDPRLARVLRRNIHANGLTRVEVVDAALARDQGRRPFRSDGVDGGRLVERPAPMAVPTVRLSTYLDEPVDFLKLNIEGAELDVLEEAGDRLRHVDQLAVEYHGWPDQPQRLGRLLDVLDRQGFRYLVNHIDYQTNAAVQPPFRFDGRSTWFAVIYARRAA